MGRREGEWVVTAKFLARFDSECDGCDGAMDQGDLIARTEDGYYICEACFPDPFKDFLNN